VSASQPTNGFPPATGPVPVFVPRPGLWERVRGVLGRIRRAGRQTLERELHPLRRRRARARLATPPAYERMLVLCYGNICRSPYAAAVLARELKNRDIPIVVEQGGFFGPGRPASSTAQSVALTRGTDLYGHRSKLITRELAGGNCLVIVMEGWQASRAVKEYGASGQRTLLLGDLDPQPISERIVSDPYGKETAEFVKTYDRIDRCVAELVAILGRR
jgi:protein-tyrosine phosphatase